MKVVGRATWREAMRWWANGWLEAVVGHGIFLGMGCVHMNIVSRCRKYFCHIKSVVNRRHSARPHAVPHHGQNRSSKSCLEKRPNCDETGIAVNAKRFPSVKGGVTIVLWQSQSGACRKMRLKRRQMDKKRKCENFNFGNESKTVLQWV